MQRFEFESSNIDFAMSVSSQIKLQEIEKMSYEDMEKLLIEKKIFKNARSIKLFCITEALRVIAQGEVDFPISFLKQDEEIPEGEKEILSSNVERRS